VEPKVVSGGVILFSEEVELGVRRWKGFLFVIDGR